MMLASALLAAWRLANRVRMNSALISVAWRRGAASGDGSLAAFVTLATPENSELGC